MTPSSPTGLEPVFQEILASATRFCEAESGCLFLCNGSGFEAAALCGVTPAFAGFLRRGPLRPGPNTGLGRVAAERKALHLPDLAAETAAERREPDWVAAVELEGARTALHVPMVRGDTLIGVVTIYRRAKRPFTENQVALAQTFAGQAVVTSENVQLLQDLQSRDRELAEGLEQQRATSEILRIIASSPTDLKPVLDAVAENAARVCGATDAVIWRIQGESLKYAAHYGPIPSMGEAGELLRPLNRGWPAGRAVLDRKTIHIEDVAAEADTEFPVGKELARRHGVRTVMATPLLREGVPIGAIAIRRMEVQPFSDKQIELLRTFADQAVIAIENVRLFQELQAKNRDLTEALEQQTATAEILRVISSSPTDVQPVFDAVARNAVTLCGGLYANVFRFDGELLHWVATHGRPEGLAGAMAHKYPMRPDASQLSGRAILAGSLVYSEDTLSDPDYDHEIARHAARRMLAAPMIREGNPIGVIVVGWAEPGKIPKGQEELLKTFADQAVIAIENVRLFEALRAKNRDLTEALEQQTATAEILRLISTSPTDLQPVLDGIAESAARLCDAKDAHIFQMKGDGLFATASHGEFPVVPPGERLPISWGLVAGRAVLGRKLVHVPDLASAEAEAEFPESVPYTQRFGHRAILAMPLLREGSAIGLIMIRRLEVGPFPDKQVSLLKTFADQAVIAIENVRLFQELQAKNRDLTEALEQQTATAEILRVISSSPTDLQPVLDAVVESAARLCGSDDVVIRSADGDGLRRVAHFGSLPDAAATDIHPIASASVGSRAFLERRAIHVEDIVEEFHKGNYLDGRALQEPVGYRTVLAMPLLLEDAAIGVILIRRMDVRPFTEKQIALLKTFADQAVIAIENVRLFNETKEALERQTATAEILKVISSSPTDVQPVFEAIARNALALCGSSFANVFRYDGKVMHYVASHQVAPELIEIVKRGFPRPADRGRVAGRAILSRSVVCIEDALVDPEYDHPVASSGGWRRMFAAPMLREGEPLGAIAVGWTEPGPIPKVQEELLKTFADQAVIAIENVRLFKELQARNRELTEALDQQTATAEILKVISSSPTDVQPVFDAIVKSGVHLFQGVSVSLRLVKGDRTERAAFAAGPGCEVTDDLAKVPYALDEGTLVGRAVLRREVTHVPDVLAADWVSEEVLKSAERMGWRAAASAPMLRESKALGGINVFRAKPAPFSDKELALLRTFADQAVIAIENVRLFNELQARTGELARSVEELQALGEVGRAVSSTLDLEKVLTTIVARALELAGANGGTISEYDEATRQFHLRTTYGVEDELVELIRAAPMRLGEGITGKAAATGVPVQVADILDEGAYDVVRVRNVMARLGYRSALAVPLLREDRIIGALTVWRREVGEFSPDIVNLLQTFATQSTLAIQHARLFRELEEKSRELELASRHKSEFLANMSHELRTPLNAVLGYTELILDSIYGEVPEKIRDVMTRIDKSGRHLLGLINDVLDLSKIEAGQLALSLADYSMKELVQTVFTAVESLAAEKKLALKVDVAADLPRGRGDERRLSQVLLNLVGNALKFTEAGDVRVKAGLEDGQFRVAVADTGPGISPSDRERIFEAFQQVDSSLTRKKGGTGLGLSIARRIVELHGGRLWVESVPGKGSTFSFSVPVRVERQVTP